MKAFFLIEYGGLYELVDVTGYVYCIVNKGNSFTGQFVQDLKKTYSAEELTWIEWEDLNNG